MVNRTDPLKFELMIVGAGIAGMAAAVFASRQGVSTVQVGTAGEIVFSSGLLDLMGVHPVENGNTWDNPWDGISAVVEDLPGHPYARVSTAHIRDAIEEFTRFIGESGQLYLKRENRNTGVITPAGTIKQTYYLPASMWQGAMALNARKPTLIIDFHGLKGFSGRQIASTLHEKWPQLRWKRIHFPDRQGELYAEQIAHSLELEDCRINLAREIKPHLNGAEAVGLPAILGLYSTQEIIGTLESLLGVSVFEIPTLPPGITGLRLKQALESGLIKRGVKTFYNARIQQISSGSEGGFTGAIGTGDYGQRIAADGVILATGRFIGRGLFADRNRIREALFDLPVRQPDERTEWHRIDFLDKRGHSINLAGIEVDESFQPLNHDGDPAYPGLYAAGSILAHQDWIRMKCGAGLAIATAYGAVNAFLQSRIRIK